MIHGSPHSLQNIVVALLKDPILMGTFSLLPPINLAMNGNTASRALTRAWESIKSTVPPENKAQFCKVVSTFKY